MLTAVFNPSQVYPAFVVTYHTTPRFHRPVPHGLLTTMPSFWRWQPRRAFVHHRLLPGGGTFDAVAAVVARSLPNARVRCVTGYVAAPVCRVLRRPVVRGIVHEVHPRL